MTTRARLAELSALSDRLFRRRGFSDPETVRRAVESSARKRRGVPLTQEHRDKISAGWARRRRFGLPE